jgi:cellulose synthase/poly-beta-1,6-N-acetylglucosamine synthase-like glycosyltransferase
MFMRAAAWLIITAYFASLGLLAVYGIHRLYLVRLHLRRRRPVARNPSILPTVTVQLPVYNEIHVLDRLVEAACRLRYPRHLLEIQILDDSTDATTSRAMDLAASWRSRGIDIVCLHRSERTGFKAGALAAGLGKARGEYIAVFDADFVPPADFLEQSLPAFADPGVGMVQARWGHLNRGYSLLTRAQALMLDAHFLVEQGARASTGRFFNFNGTAGIFRRRCIEEAGGWRSDTLTEDLDLSYRAQMEGWRFVFLEDLVCPAELPVELNSLRTQQHRWAKGSIQTARRLLPRILRSGLSPRVKLEAAFHLTNNTAYLMLFLVSLLLIPALVLRQDLGWHLATLDLVLFAAGTGSFALFCAASRRHRHGGALRALAEFPAVMMLGAGLALNNALAVLEALAGIPSGFRRTPKFRISDESRPAAASAPDGIGEERSVEGDPGAHSPARPGDERVAAPGGASRVEVPRLWQKGVYRGDPTRLPLAEGLLAGIFILGIIWAIRNGIYASVPFLALFAAGYGYVALLGLFQDLSVRLRGLGRAGDPQRVNGSSRNITGTWAPSSITGNDSPATRKALARLRATMSADPMERRGRASSRPSGPGATRAAR